MKQLFIGLCLLAASAAYAQKQESKSVAVIGGDTYVSPEQALRNSTDGPKRVVRRSTNDQAAQQATRCSPHGNGGMVCRTPGQPDRYFRSNGLGDMVPR